MSTVALNRQNANKTFKILILITALFFALLGYTAYRMNSRGVSEVPLKPCQRCTSGCPCPRLSGSIRCGCPN